VTADKTPLGQAAASSGPAAQLDIDPHVGATLYFSSVNQQGRIYERKMKIVTADDKCEPEPIVQNICRAPHILFEGAVQPRDFPYPRRLYRANDTSC